MGSTLSTSRRRFAGSEEDSMKILAAAAISTLLCGCMTTKVVFSDKWNPRSKPAYVDYFDSWWLGFYGEPEVYLQKVCMDQRPHALIRQKTAEDAVLTIFTLGIYTPTTVKIWCGE